MKDEAGTDVMTFSAAGADAETFATAPGKTSCPSSGKY